MSDDVDSVGKPKSGRLKKAFGLVAKAALWTLPLAVASSLVFDPTWLLIFHNEENMMAQAFIKTMEPYTSWLPEVVGLKGEDGLFYPLMQDFVAEEYAKLMAEQGLQQSGGLVGEVLPPNNLESNLGELGSLNLNG